MKDSIDIANEQYQQINDYAAELSQVELDERTTAGVIDELRSKPESVIEAITEQDNWALVDFRAALICAIDNSVNQKNWRGDQKTCL